jgi:type IV pilus assembly protein PilC
MPVYKYKATDPYAETVSGNYEAYSEQEVKIYLRAAGLTPISIKKNFWKGDIGGLLGGLFAKKVKTKDLIIFTRMFGAMAKAAVPLDQVLKILYKQTQNAPLKAAIQRVIVDVESGIGLGESMKKMPTIFHTIFTNMVSAGEASGNLELLMDRLADLLEKTEEIRSKIKGALIYPAALLVIGLLAVGALLIFVLPQFVEIFKSSGVTLPLPTRVAIFMGDVLVKHYMILLSVIVTFIVAIKSVATLPGYRRLMDGLLLKLPVLGTVVIKGAVARFTRTLSTLVASGVSIIDALDLVAETAGNVHVTAAIRAARANIAMGSEIAEPLAKSGVFPPLMTSMVAIGEQSGELELMLSKIADFYEVDVNRSVDAALKLIEPIMLVILGGMVGGVMTSLYLPLFDMISVVGNS